MTRDHTIDTKECFLKAGTLSKSTMEGCFKTYV